MNIALDFPDFAKKLDHLRTVPRYTADVSWAFRMPFKNFLPHFRNDMCTCAIYLKAFFRVGHSNYRRQSYE